MKRVFLLLPLLLVVVSCASIRSTPAPGASETVPTRGLSYFLPMRDIKINYIAPGKDAKTHTVTVSVSEAYAQREQHYILDFARNEVGISKMNITVTTRGLLSAAVSDVASQLSDVLVEAARTAGGISNTGDTPALPPKAATAEPCIEGQAYVTSFKPTREEPSKPKVSICGAVYANVARVAGAEVPLQARGTASTNNNGIYYRQDDAYLVTVFLCTAAADCGAESGILLHKALVAVPNTSETYFLPINRTLFGKNVATLALTDGVVTGYKEDFDGEALAVVKLPFQAIGALFDGVGQVFDSRKEVATKEAAYDEAVAKLVARQAKTERCLKAMQAKDSQGEADNCQ